MTTRKKKRGKSIRAIQRRRKRQREALRTVAGILFLAAMAGLGGYGVRRHYLARQAAAVKEVVVEEKRIPRPELDVELLDYNDYSRPGIALTQVDGIVIHYTANPGSTAIANRNYFQGLATSHVTKASSHFIVGLQGEIVQCIPCSEIAYASNSRNKDTISIECCIEDDTGKFNSDTYASAVHLTAWLLERYGLEASDVIRHYDVTGKLCPKYYVEHPDAWTQLLADIENYMAKYS